MIFARVEGMCQKTQKFYFFFLHFSKNIFFIIPVGAIAYNSPIRLVPT